MDGYWILVVNASICKDGSWLVRDLVITVVDLNGIGGHEFGVHLPRNFRNDAFLKKIFPFLLSNIPHRNVSRLAPYTVAVYS